VCHLLLLFMVNVADSML